MEKIIFCLLIAIASVSVVADEAAKAAPQQPGRKHFISENLPGLQTAEQSELLTHRALLDGARPFLTVDYSRRSELESCTAFEAYPGTIVSNFPMSEVQLEQYARAIHDALTAARSPAARKAGAEDTRCGVFAAFSISPSPVPHVFLLDQGLIVFNMAEITRRNSLDPSDLQAAAIWGVVVRRSISFGPTPPTAAIADYTLKEHEELAKFSAGKLALAAADRP